MADLRLAREFDLRERDDPDALLAVAHPRPGGGWLRLALGALAVQSDLDALTARVEALEDSRGALIAEASFETLVGLPVSAAGDLTWSLPVGPYTGDVSNPARFSLDTPRRHVRAARVRPEPSARGLWAVGHDGTADIGEVLLPFNLRLDMAGTGRRFGFTADIGVMLGTVFYDVPGGGGRGTGYFATVGGTAVAIIPAAAADWRLRLYLAR